MLADKTFSTKATLLTSNMTIQVPLEEAYLWEKTLMTERIEWMKVALISKRINLLRLLVNQTFLLEEN